MGSLQVFVGVLGVQERNSKPKEKFKESTRAKDWALVLKAKSQRLEIILLE